MSVPEYTAGTWTAVVRPGFVALLGPGAAESTVRALWQDAGEGVFAALALLARDGFGGLPPFAVVSVDGQRVHAALRGDVEVVVEVGGRQDVWRSGEVSTWTERVLEGVADVVVQVEEAPAAADSLPLADGVVHASRVRVGLTARTEVVAREAHPATGPAAVVEAARVEPTVGESAVEGDTEVPVADEPTVVPEPAVAEPVAEQVPDLDQAAEDDEADTALDDEGPVTEIIDAVVWDEPTQVELVPLTRQGEERPDPAGVVAEAESFLSTPAPAVHTSPTDVVALPAAVGAASLDDHDGLTILSTDLAEIRDQLPSWASDEVPGPFRVPEVASVAARLVLSTGLVVPLDRAVLLGRAPQVARVTNRELPRLITVPSPQQDISRTHAEVRLDGDHVVVTDLDSTNGVHVARAGEGARRLHPGEPSVVGVDEVVDLGDGVTFSVERGS
ncbi:FHA domain-containing protein [Cellulomonas humilata]|uniref:FHA domain-containing protein n=1 Tax=Cellulomonas humilata TaxID=144055 RepID=A0A7Y6DVQ3_9CELL|nr:FHA domain-containing protein [Cellulomonas humilata]NUU16701.1 FHA domain-containing protein [Cellulomonas humilata]